VPVSQHPGRDQLPERGAAEVGGRLGRGEPADQAGAGPDPADAQAAPVDLGQRADRDQVAVFSAPGVGGKRRRRRAVAQRQLGEGHVVHEHRLRVRGRQRGDALAVAGGHDQAGRVLVGRDQVHQRRAVHAQRVRHPGRVGAAVGGYPDHAGTAAVQRVQHAGEGGILHGDRLPGQDLGADDQVQCLLAAGGHHHLFRAGREAEPPGEVIGDDLPQDRQPVREVAAGLQDGPHVTRAGHRGRVGQRRRHLRCAVDDRGGQVGRHGGAFQHAGEEAVGAVHRGRGGPVRRDPRAGPLAALRHALVAQQLVSGGYRVPAHRQRDGQLPFRRQAQAGGQLAGVGEPGDPQGEQPVQGAVAGRPAPEQVGQCGGADSDASQAGPDWLCHDSANTGTPAGGPQGPSSRPPPL
jgi:hypothetical protein